MMTTEAEETVKYPVTYISLYNISSAIPEDFRTRKDTLVPKKYIKIDGNKYIYL